MNFRMINLRKINYDMIRYSVIFGLLYTCLNMSFAFMNDFILVFFIEIPLSLWIVSEHGHKYRTLDDK